MSNDKPKRDCPLCGSGDYERWHLDFSKCKKCLFVYKRDIGGSVFEELYWGTTFDPDGKIRHKSEERDLKKHCNKDEIKFIRKMYPLGGKIADIGAGMGHLLSWFDKKWEKWAIEPSCYCCDFIESTYPFLTTVRGDISKLSEYDFDVIYSHHVIEHTIDPVLEIREIHRRLKRGGWLFVVTPNIDSWVCSRFKENFRLLQDSTHISMFGETHLRKILEDQGFYVDKISKPFFRTKYLTISNLLRLFNTSKISPPFRGNVIYAYAKK